MLLLEGCRWGGTFPKQSRRPGSPQGQEKGVLQKRDMHLHSRPDCRRLAGGGEPPFGRIDIPKGLCRRKPLSHNRHRAFGGQGRTWQGNDDNSSSNFLQAGPPLCKQCISTWNFPLHSVHKTPRRRGVSKSCLRQGQPIPESRTGELENSGIDSFRSKKGGDVFFFLYN